jgi:uncharacterized protein
VGRSRAPGAAEGLRFRVTDLRRHVGERLEEVRSVTVAPRRIGDAEVSPDPVTVTVALESLSDGVRVDGWVEFTWTGSCRRCLEPATGPGRSEFRELFVDDPERYAGAAGEDEVHPVTEGWVDLAEVVADAVALGLPLAPLCGPDCPGPDPEHFPVSVEGDAAARGADGGVEGGAAAGAEEGPEAGRPVDPRWAALSELRFDRGDD